MKFFDTENVQMKTNSALVPDRQCMPKYFHLIMVFSFHKHNSNVEWLF